MDKLVTDMNARERERFASGAALLSHLMQHVEEALKGGDDHKAYEMLVVLAMTFLSWGNELFPIFENAARLSLAANRMSMDVDDTLRQILAWGEERGEGNSGEG